MSNNLLELYFKLNFLIAIAFVLWLATKQVARLLRFEVSHAQQLKVARLMFTALLLAVPLIVLVKVLMPEWAKGMVAAVSGTGIIQEFTFTAGVSEALFGKYHFGNLLLDPKLLFPALLLAGLVMQLARLARQVARLRKIMGDATEWKSIHGIHLLISSSITSPFSTRALGSKQIVLPMQLLESPLNLQLAIKHELQHVRNGDLEWVLLLEAVKVLCFWNPFAWLWHNEFDCLQEFACDEVLVNERKVNSQAYGSCLLDVASVVSGPALLASSNMVPKFSLWQNHKNQLKRRILMLVKVSNNKNVGLKTLCYSLLIGFGLLDTALAVFAAESGAADAKANPGLQKDLRPIFRVNPDYPTRALSQGLNGYVVIDFTIDETGSVQDAAAINSAVCTLSDEKKESCKEDDTFKETALNAIKKWKYSPENENGVIAKREHVQTMMRFQLEGPAKPYPDKKDFMLEKK